MFKQRADEEKAELARISPFVGAMAIGDLVKSTMGHKGLHKIQLIMATQGGSVEVTNNGATIESVWGMDNPAAKVLVEMSRVQDSEVGDGTTSSIVLASKLIGEYEMVVKTGIRGTPGSWQVFAPNTTGSSPIAPVFPQIQLYLSPDHNRRLPAGPQAGAGSPRDFRGQPLRRRLKITNK